MATVNSYHTSKGAGRYNFHCENRFATPTFGFELEVDYRGDDYIDHDETVTQIADECLGDDADYLTFESDGSLDDGFEMISQPHDFKYFNDMTGKIQNIFDYLKSCGYKSHDTSTCGLHVHIDRKYFDGLTREEYEKRFLAFFSHFQDHLTIYSRRSAHRLEDWAEFPFFESLDDIKDVDIYDYECGRYQAVNFTNDNTVEIRIWRGTLNYETFRATIRMSCRIAAIVKTHNIDDIATLTWADVLGSDEDMINYNAKAERRHA